MQTKSGGISIDSGSVCTESDGIVTETEESSASDSELTETDFSEYRPNTHVAPPDVPRESKRLRGTDAFEKTWEERDAGPVPEQCVLIPI